MEIGNTSSILLVYYYYYVYITIVVKVVVVEVLYVAGCYVIDVLHWFVFTQWTRDS